MSNTSVYGQKWSLTYRFPQGCDRSAVKNWARQICNREHSFDAVVSKLTDPQHAPQYQGVIVGVEELQQGGKRRTWEAGSSSPKVCHGQVEGTSSGRAAQLQSQPQVQDRVVHVSVAVALMFVTLGISWSNLSSVADEMVWDNAAAGQICAGCHTQLYCHAYMDLQSCAYFCYFCNKGDPERRHLFINSFSELMKIQTFLETYLPPQLSYFHPTQKFEWLSELAKVQPFVSRPQINTALKHSVAGWTECIDDIVSYCNNPYTSVRTHYTSASILRTLLRKGSPSSDHPQLHPYAWPLKPNFLNSLMKELRSSEAIVHAQRLVSDRTSTTILLFSPSGVQTPFHFDWTEAKNLALEIEGVTDPGRAVAAWYFVNPVRLEAFLSFFSGIKFVYQKVPRGYKLDEDVFSERHCADFMSKHPGCMIPLYQHVGEVVHVPPGWLHAVFTLQPSVKMAWDFVELTSLAKYMAAWAHVGTHMQHTADDYMGMATVLVGHALGN